jgi:hypothetical protein
MIGKSTEAMDWFVLINLAFLFFMLGFFACWSWLIWRRTTKPPPHIKLIIEMQEEAEVDETKTGETSAAGESERAPWERDPDWWQK